MGYFNCLGRSFYRYGTLYNCSAGYSTAMGDNTIASGPYSIAGYATNAIGINSTAMGTNTQALEISALLWEKVQKPLVLTHRYGN